MKELFKLKLYAIVNLKNKDWLKSKLKLKREGKLKWNAREKKRLSELNNYVKRKN